MRQGLAALGGVDAGQADLHLGLVLGEHGEGVAIGDAEDAAFEEFGGGGRAHQPQEPKDNNLAL